MRSVFKLPFSGSSEKILTMHGSLLSNTTCNAPPYLIESESHCNTDERKNDEKYHGKRNVLVNGPKHNNIKVRDFNLDVIFFSS